MEVSKSALASEADSAAVLQTFSEVSVPEGDYLKAIQKSLNQNRRVENRIRRLQDDCQKKKTQWKMYEAHMKELYVKEKSKYQQDLDTISRELAELESQKGQALQSLLHTIEARGPMEVEAPDALPQADNAAWDAFVQSTSSPSASANKAADQDLARALLAAQNPARFAELLMSAAGGNPGSLSALSPSMVRPPQGQAAQTAASPGLPVTPNARSANALPRTPYKAMPGPSPARPWPADAHGQALLAPSLYAPVSGTPPAVSDPYQCSPQLGSQGLPLAAPSPHFGSPAATPNGLNSAPKVRSQFGKPGDRVSVKVGTKVAMPSPSTAAASTAGHAEKVAEKRIALMQAANIPVPSVLLDDDPDGVEEVATDSPDSSMLDRLGELS